MRTLTFSRLSRGRKTFLIFNYTVLTIFALLILLPCINIVAISLSEGDAVLYGKVGLWPVGFNLRCYKEILMTKSFTRALKNTVFLTVVDTFLSLVVTLLTAYALSRNFKFKKFINYYFVVTMYFGGGLIPTYLLLTQTLKLGNTYWVLFLPGLVNVFYIIVMRTQIQQVPSSLVEAAYLDGANDFQVLLNVIIPIIVPTISAIGMFVALGTWNMWYSVMIYTPKNQFWTLQYHLRQVVNDPSIAARGTDYISEDPTELQKKVQPKNYQTATIVLVALPIVAIYPFVQKYFVKGIIAGSVKG